MFDLMALAYEADLTRVFTFMLNREASQLVFPNLGFNEPWHHVSHHGNEPEKLALLVKLNTWQIELFGKFLERLQPHARRRRLAARSLDDPLGQRHERQQHALAARRAVPDGGQGRRRVHRQPPPRGAEGHAARQRDADGRAAVRRRDRQVRRQHRARSSCRSSSGMRDACRDSGGARACGSRWWRWPGSRRRGSPRRSSTRSSAATTRPCARWLRNRADVNRAEADGTTALHWAVQANDVELVDDAARAPAPTSRRPTATACSR